MHESFDAIRHEIEEQGYCIVPDVIDATMVNRARNALDELLQAEQTAEAREARTQRVGHIAGKHPVFMELLCHEFVIDFWKQTLGQDIICSSWSANTVYPGHEAIGWHVDYPYWSKQPPWPTTMQAGQTIWMLDDFTEENGATGVVPGSHRRGHPPEEPRNVWREDGKIMTGKAGSVVLAHGAWYHTARPNQSDEPRSCLLGMYIMPWFLPQENMAAQLAELEDPSDLVKQLLGSAQHRPRSVG